MTPEIEDEIKSFVAERDAALLSGDVQTVAAFHRKHNPGAPELPRDVIEIGMHQARTGAKSLPMAVRVESFQWLAERRLQSLDEGDVKALAGSMAGHA